MRFERTTKKVLTRDIYKVCEGEQTKRIMGEYAKNSKWQPRDVIMSLFQACFHNTSVEEICESKENPSADRVQDRINELDLTQIDQLVSGWMNEAIQRLQLHPNSRISIAIDLYYQPYYGDRSPVWVVGTKRRKGTSFSLCFVLVSIATNTIRCPIYVKLLTKKEHNDKIAILSGIWSKLPLNLKIERVYLDRWFSYDPVIRFLEDRNLNYVIPARRGVTVKKAVGTIQECLAQLAEFADINFNDKQELGVWVRKRGLDTFTIKDIILKAGGTPTTLVAVFVRTKTHHADPTKRWTYKLLLYLTNCKVSPRYLVKLYGKRWIVETEIRCITTFKAFTNSISPQLRFILFGIAVLLDLLWILFSTILNRLREDNSHFSLPNYFIPIKQADTLQLTARRFLRLLRQEISPLLTFSRRIT